MLLFKATIRGGAVTDLFPQAVAVHGYVRGTRFVLPHRSTRLKHIEPVPNQPELPQQPIVVVKTKKAPRDDAAAARKAAEKRKVQAEKLRQGAASHLASAENDLNRDRQSNTARRARMAANSIRDAQQRAMIAGTMRNIADALEAGELVHLTNVSTRAQVEALDLAARQSVYAWGRATNAPYKGDHDIIPESKTIPYAQVPQGKWSEAERARLDRMGLTNDAALQEALFEYLPLRGEQRREDPIKKMERALVGQSPGVDFFPTPGPLSARMVATADIKPGMRVLEPSAGKGDLADAARDAGAEVDTIELSSTLRELLTAKKHRLVGQDFLEYQPTEGYDRIVMNPPFSKRQDVAHVRHAFAMLKPGGRLVAIMGEGSFFGSDSIAQEFRDWLQAHGGRAEKLPEGSFKSAFRPTGVNTRMVVIDKGEAMSKARTVFIKATINAPGQTALFPERVQVKGHVRGNVFIRPSMATRRKHIEEAPHQPEPPKPVVVTKKVKQPSLTDEQAEVLAGEIKKLPRNPLTNKNEAAPEWLKEIFARLTKPDVDLVVRKMARA